MATYIAMSTINAQASGWDILARGTDKAAVEADGFAEVERRYPDRLDIYSDTMRANFVVVSLTRARRMAGRCALGECAHEHDVDA